MITDFADENSFCDSTVFKYTICSVAIMLRFQLISQN